MMTKISYRGPGFFSLLGLLFIGLKLGKVITWSWWWVLAPLWIPLALSGVLLMMAFTVIIKAIVKEIKKNGRKTKN